MVFLPELFLDDTGLILGEEALAGRTSLAESGVAGARGIDDNSKFEIEARLESPITMVGI